MTTRAQTRKLVTLVVVAGTVLSAGTWFGVRGPQLSQADTAREQLSLVKVEAQGLRMQADTLTQKAGQVDAVLTEVQAISAQFPAVFDQAVWLSEVQRAAEQADVTIDSVSSTPPAPVVADGAGELVDPAAPAAPDAAAPEPLPDPATPTAPTADETPSADPVLATPTTPVAEATVTLTVTGAARAVSAFLAALEMLPRPLLVENVQVGSAEDAKVRATIDGRTLLVQELETPDLRAP